MSKIKVNLGVPAVNGKQVSFFCPCGSADAECIIIDDVEYALVDAYGKSLTGIDYSWASGALVSVILDTVTKKAYVQNATSNAYIEDTFLKTTTKPEDIGAAASNHSHALTDSGITGILPISKGGTGASNVDNARTNLGFISGSYTGTGNSGSSSNMYKFDTGARGSNVVIIHGVSVRGFLCPMGGVMIADNSALGAANVMTFGSIFDGVNTNADQRACYADGYIMLSTNHEYINKSGAAMKYWCL